MKKLLSASVITLMITGCAAIPADPQAERVIASPNPAPKGCKYVGQVVGNQGNSLPEALLPIAIWKREQ